MYCFLRREKNPNKTCGQGRNFMVLSKFYGETPGAWASNTYSANSGILQVAGLVQVEYVQEQRHWIIKHHRQKAVLSSWCDSDSCCYPFQDLPLLLCPLWCHFLLGSHRSLSPAMLAWFTSTKCLWMTGTIITPIQVTAKEWSHRHARQAAAWVTSVHVTSGLSGTLNKVSPSKPDTPG